MWCVGKYWGYWGKTTTNDGQPQVEEEYKKVVFKRVDERTLEVHLEHH
jgi:hypothetical protein